MCVSLPSIGSGDWSVQGVLWVLGRRVSIQDGHTSDDPGEYWICPGGEGLAWLGWFGSSVGRPAAVARAEREDSWEISAIDRVRSRLKSEAAWRADRQAGRLAGNARQGKARQ